MEKYIKYKRFTEFMDDKALQNLFDWLVTDGWEIIFYKEEAQVNNNQNLLRVSIIAGKRQEDKI